MCVYKKYTHLTMSNYKIQNIVYSAALNSYDKNSRLVDKVLQQSTEVQDTVSLGLQKNLDFGGVESSIAKGDILMAGDQLKTDSTTKIPFFSIIQDQFDKIRQVEALSTSDSENDVNLPELAASLNEAEIALQQIVHIRDKIVSGYKEILNSSF